MRIIFVIAGLLFSMAICAQRDTIHLNTGWHFTTDIKAVGLQEKWHETGLPTSRLVQLPHTWNVEKENQNHYGWAWYQKKLFVPAAWKNKRVLLLFGAVNHTCIIYLNGKKIAGNKGDGFSKFSVNMADHLQLGKENRITVAVNNDYGKQKVPFANSFDWPNDGGIIRKVSLIVSEKPAAAYIHLLPRLNLQTGEGKLDIKLGFEVFQKDVSFNIKTTEENQPTSQEVYEGKLLPQWKNKEAIVQIALPKVNPWHFDHPNLYRVEVTISNKKKLIDRVSAVTGFKELKFVNGQTYFNGERVKLMGVEWTAGSNPDYGFAEPDSVILRYCKLMKEVNTIFTRQHFQQDDLFYDFCDRNGILVQQEIPLWGPETPANDTIRKIAMKQLEAMVANNYNHTSVFSWGVGNELRGRDADMKQFIRDMLQRCRELDPDRMTAYVSNTLTAGFSNNPSFVPDAAAEGDYLAMNEYGGSWWNIPEGKIHLYLDSVHMSYPGKPFFISEFGLCEPNFKGGDERRIRDMIYHMAIYESKPYVEGAIYFDLTDYRTHYPGTADKNKFRRRIHGVFDMYGNPKPSAKVLRDLSSPVEIHELRKSKDKKKSLLLFGNLGLPQHCTKGYKLYVSDNKGDFRDGLVYNLPDIYPGQQLYVEIDDLYPEQALITITRPTGYVVIQKLFTD